MPFAKSSQRVDRSFCRFGTGRSREREASPYFGDHYIIITGVMADGYLYNDAIDADGVGYDRLISADGLARAMTTSDRRYTAAGFALARS
jgi:hypothetical protein